MSQEVTTVWLLDEDELQTSVKVADAKSTSLLKLTTSLFTCTERLQACYF